MEHTGILGNLARQSQCYRDLLNLARKKKDILVAGQVQELDKLLAAEHALILRAGRLEEERLSLVKDLAAQRELDAGEITLGHLIEGLEEPEQSRARELAGELRELLAELQAENRLNQQLIRQSLDFIEFSLGLFSAKSAPLLDEKA